jgi:hypothetical protein
VVLSQRRHKIAGGGGLADWIGNPVKGEGYTHTGKIYRTEMSKAKGLVLIGILPRKGGRSGFVLWWKLKSACRSNFYGRAAQLQATVNSGCWETAMLLYMTWWKTPIAGHTRTTESCLMPLPDQLKFRFLIWLFNSWKTSSQNTCPIVFIIIQNLKPI